MILLDVAVGSRVRIYAYGGTPASLKTRETDDVWVVAGINTHPDSYTGRVLIGWKPGEKRGISAWTPTDNPSLLPSDRSLVNGYERAYWAPGDTLVESVLTGSSASVAASQGMFCRGCKDWNPYAVPNRPSNNFVCWSCKQGFVPADW